MQSLLKKYLGTIAFFLSLTLTIFKMLPKWERAPMWAEDGAKFLSLAYLNGFRSLFVPVDGSIHIVPRLTMCIATFFPVDWAVYFPLTLSALIFAGTVSKFTSSDYTYLFPSQIIRFLFMLALLAMPGQNESLGNLGNLHWYLTLFCVLTLVKQLSSSFTVFELFFWFFAVTSCGELVVFLPALLLRIYLQKKEEILNTKERWALFFLAAAILINLSIRERVEIKHPPKFFEFTATFFFSLFNHYFLHPFLGGNLTYGLAALYPGLYWCSVTVMGIITVKAFRHLREEDWLFVLCTLCFLGIPLLAGLVRPNALPIWNSMKRGPDMAIYRYGSYLGPAGVFFTFWILKQSFKKHLLIAIAGFTAIYLFHARKTFIIYPDPHSPSWSEGLAIARSSPCAEMVDVPIQPKGWVAKLPGKYVCR